MATQYLCGAVHSNIADSATRNRLQEALDNMANELTNATSHTYYSYGPNDHYWDAPTSASGRTEKEYVKAFLRDVGDADDAGNLVAVEGDVWCIIDAFGDKADNSLDDRWGYGTSVPKYYVNTGQDYVYLWGCRAAACGKTWAISDPSDMTKSFVKHEIGHNFGCGHRHGTYVKGSAGNYREITPMASAYVRWKDGSKSDGADTCWWGSGTLPGWDNSNDFCYNRPNFELQYYCGACTEKCRHDMDGPNLTSCTESQIASKTPLSNQV